MSEYNFMVGDLVEVVAPGNIEEKPYWMSSMSRLIGKTFTIRDTTTWIYLKGHTCALNPAWLKPAAVNHFEKNLKVGDMVLVTKPEGETSLWSNEMDKIDGMTCKIERPDGLHFWKVRPGICFRFHEGWLTKVEAEETPTEDLQAANEELKKENAALSESLEGERVEKEMLKDNLEALRQQHEELCSKGLNLLKVTPMNHIYRF